jgi:hypothetical protein
LEKAVDALTSKLTTNQNENKLLKDKIVALEEATQSLKVQIEVSRG